MSGPLWLIGLAGTVAGAVMFEFGTLLGVQVSVQGLTLDWGWGIHLTNALDVVLGSE